MFPGTYPSKINMHRIIYYSTFGQNMRAVPGSALPGQVSELISFLLKAQTSCRPGLASHEISATVYYISTSAIFLFLGEAGIPAPAFNMSDLLDIISNRPM